MGPTRGAHCVWGRPRWSCTVSGRLPETDRLVDPPACSNQAIRAISAGSVEDGRESISNRQQILRGRARHLKSRAVRVPWQTRAVAGSLQELVGDMLVATFFVQPATCPPSASVPGQASIADINPELGGLTCPGPPPIGGGPPPPPAPRHGQDHGRGSMQRSPASAGSPRRPVNSRLRFNGLVL